MDTLVHPAVNQTKDRYLRLVLVDTVLAGLFYVVMTLQGEFDQDPEKVFATVGLFMLWSAVWEVLTGAFADIFKRRAATIASFALSGLAGLALVFYSLDIMKDLAGQAYIPLYTLGAALISGSLEAWLYDRVTYYSPKPPDLAGVFRREMVTTIWGTAAGYCLGILVLSILLFAPALSLQPRMDLALFGGILLVGVAVVGAVDSWRMSEEYWMREEFRHQRGLFGYVIDMFKIVLVEKRTYGSFVALYAIAYSLGIFFTLSMWPLLWLSVKDSQSWFGAALGDDYKFIMLALVYVVMSSLAALAARAWQKRSRLLTVTESEVRPVHLVLASLWNFVPMVPVGVAVLYREVIGYYLLLVLAAAVLIYRLGLVMRQGLYKAVLQRTVKDSSHRAVLLSLATAAGSVLNIVGSLIFVGLYGEAGDAYRMLAMAWVFAPIAVVIFILLFSWACKSSLFPSQQEKPESVKVEV